MRGGCFFFCGIAYSRKKRYDDIRRYGGKRSKRMEGEGSISLGRCAVTIIFFVFEHLFEINDARDYSREFNK